jgi:hypothetical protein
VLPEEPSADNGLPRRVCEAVRDWLITGRDAGKFVMHNDDVGDVKAEQPLLPLTGKFPQLYVVWTEAVLVSSEVANPTVCDELRFGVQVRFYTQDPMQSQLVKDCRDLAWAVYRHLRLNRSYGGLVLDVVPSRVTGDTEYLLRQNIAANGLVELRATGVDRYTMES